MIKKIESCEMLKQLFEQQVLLVSVVLMDQLRLPYHRLMNNIFSQSQIVQNESANQENYLNFFSNKNEGC